MQATRAVPLALAVVLFALCSGCASSSGGQEEAATPGGWTILTPLKDGARFSPVVTHPYMPLSRVRYTELRSERGHVLVNEVLDRTHVVAGVECLILAEKDYNARGEITEITSNYFAQDERGNVYYFGEDVDDYKDGRVVGHGGAWLVGRNAAEPCLFMPADLRVGFRFKRENSPPEAEEFDEVESLSGTLAVPHGVYHDVLIIKEGDTEGEWSERKYYARGVGAISENRSLNLVSIGRPGTSP